MHRAVQVERIEQALLEQLGDGLAGDVLHHQSEQDVVGVRVLPGRPRREQRRLAERQGQELVGSPDPFGVLVDCPLEHGVLGVAGQSAAHVEQLGDRDVVAVGDVGPVLGDRIVERQLAFLGQLQDDRRRHRLGDAADPVVIGRRRQIVAAQTRDPNRNVASPNFDDRTRTTADGTCIESTSSVNTGPSSVAYPGAAAVVDVEGDDAEVRPRRPRAAPARPSPRRSRSAMAPAAGPG